MSFESHGSTAQRHEFAGKGMSIAPTVDRRSQLIEAKGTVTFLSEK